MTDIVQPKTTVEILTEARAFIEKGWTQGELARDSDGRETETRCEDAVCWCALGALHAAEVVYEKLMPAFRSLVRSLPDGEGMLVAAYNDDPATTKEDILALFDRAIANEKAKAASV